MRQYYNPDITDEEAEALDRENVSVLAAVQAALGNISTDIRAVFVDGRAQPATLHFVVAQGRESACAEDIEDTVSEFEGQTWGGVMLEVRAQVHIEEIPRNWPDLGWRPLYWSKSWVAWRDTGACE